jgi:hypothetical protein
MTADLTKHAETMEKLIEDVRRESDAQAQAWLPIIERAGIEDSAANLAAYLAVRRRDLRTIQRNLMLLGLSSMGQLESRVMPKLLAVKSALAALLNRPPAWAFGQRVSRLRAKVGRDDRSWANPLPRRRAPCSSPVPPRPPTTPPSCLN